MKIYEYDLPDGRIAFSQLSLEYALNNKKALNLEQLSKELQKQLTIVPSGTAANIMRAMLREDTWIMPEQLVSYTKTERIAKNVSAEQSICIVRNGEILVWLDGKYEPLEVLFSRQNKKYLHDMTRLIAFQSALAQLAISTIQNEG